MENSWLPETTHEGLTQDRLVIIGDILRRARDGAATKHEPAMGETSWSLGTRAYERTEFEIIAASLLHPWLQVIEGESGGPVRFAFAIAGHTFRFFKGAPDEVPAKYLAPVLSELIDDLQEQRKKGLIPTNSVLRFSVQTDPKGFATEITLVEIDLELGAVTRQYVIPLIADAGNVVPFDTPKSGVMPPSPSVKAKGNAKKAKKADGA